ncbi:MAG: hypothetical protein WDZ51_11895 [Pirellulaceae bacterium]
MRRRIGKNAVEISLFPFLAVLICTMGALIVLFVVMVLQARTAADPPPLAIEAPPPQVEEPQEPTGPPKAEVEEQIRMLKQLREEGQARLEESRLRLSGLEDHIQRVLEELRQLKGQIDILEAERDNQSASPEQTEEKIQAARRKIQEAEAKLEELREELKGRKPAYALVPYEGRNGTQRQPIYIECTEKAVIIQPEGIYLDGADFGPPMGPGNPLASALRIIREYRAEQAGGLQANPYPLLIVRPGGAESYAAAREALKSWDADFGYELVDDELELAYPTADPFLAKQLVQAVEFARRRKIALIEAAPGRYGRLEDNPGLTASRNGGFQTIGRRGGEEGNSPFGENRFISGGGGASAPTGLSGRPGGGEHTPTDQRRGRNGQGPGMGGEESLGGDAPRLTSADGKSSDSNSEQSGKRTGPRGEVGQEMNPNSDLAASSEPGQMTTSSAQLSENNASQNSNPAGQDQGQGAQGPKGTQNGTGGTGGSGRSDNPLAAQRGQNWALKQGSPRSTGITRPVSIECGGGELMLLPEPGSRLPARTIDVSGDPVEGIDHLVQLIDQRIDSWASAGRELYWKPVLHVQVLPGGEARFEQLQTLLYGSGMEVIRK